MLMWQKWVGDDTILSKHLLIILELILHESVVGHMYT
jgi:hypothetical protein